ncbi:hypothetical protein [Desulfobacula phenolica]|uniref:Uncharacterized protein n=1 Tax=Desulfobacula phenolica TaxID=90732 RepID=A0A1H2KG69_9BACT|nr:hypothetical protein [Desulfobacula phenolica]SDU67408.1 hypothetical protein SAMN04487931_1401 [Desulfobacula phenolica]
MRRFTDSNLRVFAIVEAQLTKKLNRPTDYLIPFFQASISKYKGKQLSIKEVVKYIRRHYSLDVPIYLAESLIPRLEQIGSLEYVKDFGCHVCQEVELTDADIQLNQSHFDLIEESIKRYCKRIELKIAKPLDSKNWQKALLRFFEQDQDSKTSAMVKGKKVTNTKELDDRIISRFIFKTKTSDPQLFNIIVRIYSAYAIVDTVLSIQKFSAPKNWSNLNVIYDSTVLMRILGTSGSFMREATLQMHNLLQNIGCKTLYFDHNLSEVLNNIQSIISKVSYDQPLHSETSKAFQDGDITLGELNLLIGSIEKKLESYNIKEITLPPRLSDISGQIDPISLKNYLTENIHYKHYSAAAQIDADSVEKVLFLRKDCKHRDLPKCGYIFVTHNSNYAKYSKFYCQKHCGYNHDHTPPVINLSLLTRLSWLSSSNGTPKVDISNELLINCFEASLPDDKWVKQFWKTIERHNPEVLDPDTKESLYLLELKKVADDLSLGSDVFLEEIDTSYLLKRAEELKQEREKKYENKVDQVSAEKQNEIDQLKKEKESQFCSLEKEKEKEIKELQKLFDQQKKEAVRKAIEQIKSEQDAIIIKKSQRHARFVGSMLTIVLGLFFGYIFYVSQVTPPQWVIESEYSKTIKYISLGLGALQVVGLFNTKFSFLFIGPFLEKGLSSIFFKIYN